MILVNSLGYHSLGWTSIALNSMIQLVFLSFMTPFEWIVKAKPGQVGDKEMNLMMNA